MCVKKIHFRRKKKAKEENFADICQVIMSLNKVLLISCLTIILNAIYTTNSYRYHDHKENDLSLWINEQQVKILSGFSLKVFIINYGWVSPHVKDPNFSTHLPLVPSEVVIAVFHLVKL